MARGVSPRGGRMRGASARASLQGRSRTCCAALAAGLLLLAALAGAQPAEDPCAVSESWVDVAGAAEPFEDGVGGTGLLEPDDGVGGTGWIEPDDGVGGTGWIEPRDGVGGTGFYGTITGFGSICVNGERIHYDDAAEVLRDGDAAALDDLAVGQVVWVLAQPFEGDYEAEQIRIVDALSGILEEVDVASGRIRVGGREVEVPEASLLVGAAGAPLGGLHDLVPGTTLAIAGLEDAEGLLVASRVEAGAPGARGGGTSLDELLEAAPPLASVSVEGFVAERGADGAVRVEGLWVELPESVRVERNERVWMRGRLSEDRVLRPERFMVRPLRDRLVRRPGARKPVAAAAAAATTAVRTRAALTAVRPDRVSRIRRQKPAETTAVVEAEDIEALPVVDRVDAADTTVAAEAVDAPFAGTQAIKLEAVKRAVASGNVDAVEAAIGSDRVEAVKRAVRSERLEAVERSGGGDRPEAAKRAVRLERARAAERRARADRVDRPRRPERPVRVQRTERPARPERVARPERPPRPDAVRDRLVRPDRIERPPAAVRRFIRHHRQRLD